MKLKRTQTIDGITVILSIESADGMVDPEATRPLMLGLLEQSDEYKSVEAQKSAMFPLLQAAQAAFNNAKQAQTPEEKNRYVSEYQDRQKDLQVIEDKIKEIYPSLVAKQSELYGRCAVYFNPGKDAELIDDDTADKISSAMQKATENNKYIDSDLNEVSDLRGVSVWLKKDKWIGRVISIFGDVPKDGEIMQKDLTDKQNSEIATQVNADRIAALSASDKKAEKASVLSGLSAHAAQMRGQLEITGDAAALKKAQAWYAEQSAQLDITYA